MNYSQWMGIYRKSSFRFMLWLSLCILLFSCPEKTVAQEPLYFGAGIGKPRRAL